MALVGPAGCFPKSKADSTLQGSGGGEESATILQEGQVLPPSRTSLTPEGLPSLPASKITQPVW